MEIDDKTKMALALFLEAVEKISVERQKKMLFANRETFSAQTDAGHRTVDRFTQAAMFYLGDVSPEGPKFSRTSARIHAFPKPV